MKTLALYASFNLNISNFSWSVASVRPADSIAPSYSDQHKNNNLEERLVN